MDRVLLLDAVRQLETLGPGSGTFARAQAVRQFNALLQVAQGHYPNRQDIQSLQWFQHDGSVDPAVYRDAVQRLRVALELRLPAGVIAILDAVRLPAGVPPAVIRDIGELREAAALGLAKTTLLLSGLIAEALLLSRHPDRSDRGPGLGTLVVQARKHKLFGRDILRNLETLVDYRDLIHPRAEVRSRIEPNEARVEAAVTALKMLCSELEDPELQFPEEQGAV